MWALVTGVQTCARPIFEAVVVEHCPTDFDRPARIQAIAALSHGFFLLSACRFAGNAALISSKTASDSDPALPDAATQAEYRLSRSRSAPAPMISTRSFKPTLCSCRASRWPFRALAATVPSLDLIAQRWLSLGMITRGEPKWQRLAVRSRAILPP